MARPAAVAAMLAAAAVAALLAALAAWAGSSGFAAAAGSGLLAYSMALSVATATVSATLAIVAAVPVGYALSRRMVPASSLVEALLLTPFAMPPVAMGVALLVLLVGPASWLNRVLDLVFTPRGLVAAQLAVTFPMAIRVVRGAFDAVPPKLEAVARSLGCSWWCSFTRVALPLAARGLSAAWLLSFLRSLGEFGASAVLAGVKRDTATLPIAIYLELSGGESHAAAALATLSALVAAVGAAGLLMLEKRSGETTP